MKYIILGILILVSTITFSQEVLDAQKVNYNDAGNNKGKMFAYWGWNRGHYSTSNITFK